ncbi:hypothetical protein AAZX31_02G175900 [Glycine max]|nr:hypothetical protein JHK86_004694 [Glycine max]
MKNGVLQFLFISFLAFATPLVVDLSHRSSFSILTVPNAYLTTNDHLSLAALVDVLCYHVLLQLLSWSDLRALPPFRQAHHHTPSNLASS